MIQIDMPMPKNCFVCPACNEYLTCAIPVNGRKWGENNVREFEQGRPEWCPMKEQEAPHIVRCKDCKYWQTNTQFCTRWSAPFATQHTSSNWYCADGERKEGDGE